MQVDLWKAVGVALTIGAIIFGIGRYVGALEHRITILEGKSDFLHGKFSVPGDP